MATFSRILLPTDFSRSSYAAFRPARQLARKFRSKVCILHVFDPAPFLLIKRADISQEGIESAILNNAAVELRKAARRLGVPGAELLIRKGNPHREIIKVAKEKRIDLIIMGTVGRTSLERMVLGSVSEKVVRLAPCQVLTVKPQ
jgi:universal stress protein A